MALCYDLYYPVVGNHEGSPGSFAGKVLRIIYDFFSSPAGQDKTFWILAGIWRLEPASDKLPSLSLKDFRSLQLLKTIPIYFEKKALNLVSPQSFCVRGMWHEEKKAIHHKLYVNPKKMCVFPVE